MILFCVVIQKQHPSLVDIVQLDVTSDATIEQAVKHVHSAHSGKLDLLINCSGILSPTGRGETSLKEVSFKVRAQ